MRDAVSTVVAFVALVGWGITIGVYKGEIADLVAQVAEEVQRNTAQDEILTQIRRDSATQGAMYRFFVCRDVMGDPEAECRRRLEADIYRIELADSAAADST